MKIIGFSGKAGSGKDTAAKLVTEALEEYGNRVTKLSFADPLKAVCALMFGWDYDRLLNDYDYKEGDTLDDGSPDPACEMLGMTRRVVMQKVGTECFREGLHQEAWIIALKLAIQRGEYDEFDYGLLTDCRFINELQFVKDLNGKLILIQRTGERSTLTASTEHKSETEWETWNEWDSIVENEINEEYSEEHNLSKFRYRLLKAIGYKPKMTPQIMTALEEQWNEHMSDTYWDGETIELTPWEHQ